ncbi:ubiquitin-conjugating enzyme/RWD-like protein [Radiomyces spectabilis]|uniref:ubiquitin-conjugating enzyme/RWD-like protein n=1 Tax=Radiomyces spectabilis TaxID=64574 RepID=UPI00221F921E|nr:ubiquitin-conjugating enzyme/RWD-like protein [Radiomyces spectabilis]KAI8391093.1 ubiquitin-conjugating enzyme/RWD-like protein [Radiomyces spectabilis]
MATKAAYKRLTKEYLEIQKNPPPFITAKPNESNILEWHYVIQGPPDTPYDGGEYYGRLTFPSDYPYKPPAIRMSTPSGRFQPDTRLCLTMSDFHPSLWNPSWSVVTILNGLLSFMTTDESTTGSIKSTDLEKRLYASRSHNANLRNPKFREAFPELCIRNPPTSNPAITDSILRKRLAKQAAAKHPTSTEDSGNSNNSPNALTRTVTRWRRWMVILLVFIYLIISKIIARSSAAGEGTA